MKLKLLFSLLLGAVTLSETAGAADIDTGRGYLLDSVQLSIGYNQNIGIALNPGDTCEGKAAIILLQSNAYFDEIYSALFAASMAGKEVHFGPSFGFDTAKKHCTVREASIDRWFTWSTQ